MKQIKDFLNSAVKALGKALLALSFLILLCIMLAWSVGLIYVAHQGGCSIEDNRVVCEMKKE